MSRVKRLYQSSIGKKTIMAVTGLILFGFVIVHMLGNLQVFLGPEAYNAYAKMLKGSPGLLWGVRSLLLVSVILHIHAAVTLAAMQRRARPIGYQQYKPVQASYASRTMMWSGPILLAFIVYHILHFTTGHAFTGGTFSHTDVYTNFITAFRNPAVAGAYIVAMLALGMHLMHGVYSLFQTLGLNPTYRDAMQSFALGAAGVIMVGNITMPLAVLFKVIN